MPEALIVRGTKKERQTFYDVDQHYRMAKDDLEQRFADWDAKDELFRSHIRESGWPYSAEIFVPHTFTALFEKMARLNGGKPRGRLIPREGGDVIKAKINNELLNFQWDEAGRVDNEPMVAKYARMDLNTRLYGASFAIAKWRYECDKNGDVLFDGPVLKVLNNRDCLPNPSYSTIKNWFQYRDYVTIQELERVNDISLEKPVYKNLKLLKDAVVEESKATGDLREENYMPHGRAITGQQDFLGHDEAPEFRTVEIVTEYRNDRKIVFSPKHGVILEDGENPYDHNQIPVTMLKYIPIDDDIYGLSEIEPVEKIQKAMNALTSQYIDAINMDLYRILKVNKTGVQMQTIKWAPGAVWTMNNPERDVIPLETSMSVSSKFVDVYSLLVSMFNQAMGESSGAFSTLQPSGSQKTATEIQDSQTTKSSRDNFNQVFLSETIKKQMTFWLLMNQQFTFSDPAKSTLLLRVVGRDAIQEFQTLGLDSATPDTSPEEMMIHESSILNGQPVETQSSPQYPVSIDGKIQPKFSLDQDGRTGVLVMTPDDMTGNYDYIADVEPMQVTNTAQETRSVQEAVELLANPQILQLLQQEQKIPKISELLVDLFDRKGLKNSDKYFETLQLQPPMGGLDGMPQEGMQDGQLPTNGAGAVPGQAGGIPTSYQGA